MHAAEQLASAGRSSPSFVVGIGASAGGLESLEKLFQNLPTDTGMAFVIVQHLSPEALGCLSRVTPSFVLLDMLMPECDGRETLQRICQIPAFEKLPVYAVSGSSPESVGLSIGSDGVDDWFPKPLNASRLVQHMRARVASL